MQSERQHCHKPVLPFTNHPCHLHHLHVEISHWSTCNCGMEHLPLWLTLLFLAASALANAPANPPSAGPAGAGDGVPAEGSEPGTMAALRSRFSASLTFFNLAPP